MCGAAEYAAATLAGNAAGDGPSGTLMHATSIWWFASKLGSWGCSWFASVYAAVTVFVYVTRLFTYPCAPEEPKAVQVMSDTGRCVTCMQAVMHSAAVHACHAHMGAGSAADVSCIAVLCQLLGSALFQRGQGWSRVPHKRHGMPSCPCSVDNWWGVLTAWGCMPGPLCTATCHTTML
jgi:hypothetical protein